MHRRLRGARGMTLVEVVLAMAVVGIAGGVAIGSVERSVTTARESGAARAFMMRVRQARLEAVRRSAAVGLQFSVAPGKGAAPSFRAYADGNGNGLRTREIASGIDRPIGTRGELADGLGGVRFALAADVPPVGEDDGGAGGGGSSGGAGASGGGGGVSGSEGLAAIRLGASTLLSFVPTGSGTSGTIYLRGPTRQFAVRVFGPTGRVRLLEFERQRRVWVER
jgi:prepilin-type N-terminal cleavage/methylation domain-containing protein